MELLPNDNLYKHTKMLIYEIEPMLPAACRYDLFKILVQRSLMKVKETIKILHKRSKEDIENQGFHGNNPESPEIDNPFEQSVESSFGIHLAKYMQKKGISAAT